MVKTMLQYQGNFSFFAIKNIQKPEKLYQNLFIRLGVRYHNQTYRYTPKI